MRATAGGGTKDGHRIENGQTYAVAGFTKGGDVVLNNGWVASKDFGTWDAGYLSTSHAAQGRTVQRVLVVQSALSAPATSDAQAYVSVSRGKARPGPDGREAVAAGGGRAGGPAHERLRVHSAAAAPSGPAATPCLAAAAAGGIGAAAPA